MGLLFLWLGLALCTQIWLCIRVGRSSVPLGVATFVIGFPAAIYTFFRHRGDPDTSVTAPFVINLVFTALFFASVWSTLMPMLAAQEAAFEQSVAAAGGPSAQLTEGLKATPRVAAPASEAASGVARAASQADAAASAVVQQAPIEAFSAALEASGLKHTLTRITAAAQLPAGVTDAALFSVTPLGSAAASAPGSAAEGEVPATLFTCESAVACRHLAGVYLQQTGDAKRRVLQNGLMLLSLPAVPPGAADLTPTAVASVFRKL